MFILTYKSKLDNPEDTHLLALVNPPTSGTTFRVHKVQVFSVGNAEFRVKMTEDYKVKGRTNGSEWINNVTDEELSRAIVVVDLKSDGIVDDFLKIKTCLVNASTAELITPDDQFVIQPGRALVLKVAADNRFTMVGTNVEWTEDGLEDEAEEETEIEEYVENANA